MAAIGCHEIQWPFRLTRVPCVEVISFLSLNFSVLALDYIPGSQFVPAQISQIETSRHALH